jgi:acetolactate synthase-1/2/3 large subunit
MSAALTAGDLLARTLKQAGVRDVFALHGGHLESFYRGCVDEGITLIDFRHEAAAGHAADAYARATGGLAVCVITAGPGFANAMPAIVQCHLDQVPVLFLIGAPPLREAETNPLQGGFDQIAMALPVTKWAHRITNPERTPDLTALAIRTALTGRKGPVLLELPIDVLHVPVHPDDATQPLGLLTRPRPAPAPAEAEAFADLIREAKRPVLVAGGDARFSHAGKALTRFADRTGIPCVFNSRGMGLLAPDHACYGHDQSALAVLAAIRQPVPDLVILLGARMGLYLSGRSGAMIPKAAKLAHIHADPAELGRLQEADVAIAADCGLALEAALAALGEEPLPDWSAWRGLVTGMQHAHEQMFPTSADASPMHPFHAAKALHAAVREAVGEEALFVLDGGEAASWGLYHARVRGPGRVMSHGYLGCLGIGMGMAIGAQIAEPSRRVVHITGDGAMGFHIQEFDTMARRGLPVLTVVLNNKVWGMSIHGQQMMFGPNYQVITALGDTHYANVAAAFGCHAERVETLDAIGPAVAHALASGKPACLELMVDGSIVQPGTTAMLGAVTDETKEILIPYYENIKLR